MINRFEWDPEKAARNLAKHGIEFADVTPVFLDPSRLELPSHRNGEARTKVIGVVDDIVLVVVYALRDNGRLIRLISARKASSHEKRKYTDSNRI